MRKSDKVGIAWNDWMFPWNSERRKHADRQRILALCYKARKNELYTNAGNSKLYLINSLITVPKKDVWAWVRSNCFDLCIHSDNGMIVIDVNAITKIF